jgi:broad specificity phosphatase PhoE
MQEAESISKQLANYPVNVIYSSDLRRARQTAEILRREIKSRVIATQDLRPWNLGVFCGQRVRDLLPFLAQLNEHPEVAAPSGESFHQFYGRYSARLLELMNLAERSVGDVIAVTHVRNLLATKSIVEHGDRNRVPVRGGPPTGSLITVEKDDGVWKIFSRSDHSAKVSVAPEPRVAFEVCT